MLRGDIFMNTNFKEYLRMALVLCKNEIESYKYTFGKCEVTKEICDFMHHKESLLYAGELLLKEL